MSSLRSFRLILSLLTLLSAISAGGMAQAAGIEANPDKKYRLHNVHGPWMVMVATFHSTSKDGESAVGKTPEQASDELVLELRNVGIPAYSFMAEGKEEFVETRNRLGDQVRVKKNQTRLKTWCVLAGNYRGVDDKTAEATLDWLKKYSPKCLTTGGVKYNATPGRPLPLSGAFLTINPLLSAEEVAQRSPDPLLKRLNSGVRHSLSENKGQYTLVIAHYAGQSITELKAQSSDQGFMTNKSLDRASEEANELVTALRQDLSSTLPPRNPSQPDENLERVRSILTKFKNTQAYVWHDRFESVVTVGSFSSPNDPAIQRYMQLFEGKTDPRTGQYQVEYLPLPEGSGTSRMWAFDPTPVLMRVPDLR